MTRNDLRELLASIADDDLVDGADINDHPAMVASTTIDELDTEIDRRKIICERAAKHLEQWGALGTEEDRSDQCALVQELRREFE